MRLVLFLVVALAGVALAGVSLLPLIPSNTWWVRIADFPRLQLAIALCVLALVMACFWRRYPRASQGLIGMMLAVVLYHAVVLLPFLPSGASLARADCPSPRRLSVMVANVRLGNDPEGRLLAQVRRYQPDVFLALEVNDQWTQALSPLTRNMPHHVTHTTGSYFGIALYSRLPLVDPEIRHLAGQNTPQIVTGLQLRTGEVIDFLGIHPRPPHPSQSTLGRDAVLMKAGLLLRDQERPGMIAGDLNATPWERAIADLQEIARLIDPRAGYGFLPTYDAQSWWMAWPLDHVFYETGFVATHLERGERFGSDHYPYVARLCRVDRNRSNTPDATEEETLRHARAVIQRARARAEAPSRDAEAG